MLKSILKVTGNVLLATVDEVLFNDTQGQQSNEQLEQLNDGLGNIVSNNESLTWQEAETSQCFGELYDTYL
tara:strand:- start:726 stop:938 length:213 start_codon:yes stop_codon:yes gene_type:complete